MTYNGLQRLEVDDFEAQLSATTKLDTKYPDSYHDLI
jgi:hypothetical protein